MIDSFGFFVLFISTHLVTARPENTSTKRQAPFAEAIPVFRERCGDKTIYVCCDKQSLIDTVFIHSTLEPK
jgi:hypothetical protein